MFGFGADAVFTKALLENEPGATTGEVSVSYRLSQRDAAEYELRANEFMRDLFRGGPLPWRDRGVAPGIIPSRALLVWRIGVRVCRQTHRAT